MEGEGLSVWDGSRLLLLVVYVVVVGCICGKTRLCVGGVILEQVEG